MRKGTINISYIRGGKQVKTIHNKLVRDNIPEIIQRSGKKAHYRVLDNDKDFDKALKLKLIEEANELYIAETEEECVEELADIVTVLSCLLANRERTKAVARAKLSQKGGFFERYFLESVEDEE